MPSSANRTKHPVTAAQKPTDRTAAPRVADLRRLEQKLSPETDYSVEFPRREPWTPLFEFPRDN